jgi:hypothetical protein
MIEDSFEAYSHKIEKAIDIIPANEILGTQRHGLAGFRDKLVMTKAIWTEALGYFAIVQSLIIFTALVPNAFENINQVIKPTGFQFPIIVASLTALIFIIFLLFFGYFSYKYFGTAKRAGEIGAKLSSCDYVEWKDLQVIKQGIEDLQKDVKELKK